MTLNIRLLIFIFLYLSEQKYLFIYGYLKYAVTLVCHGTSSCDIDSVTCNAGHLKNDHESDSLIKPYSIFEPRGIFNDMKAKLGLILIYEFSESFNRFMK